MTKTSARYSPEDRVNRQFHAPRPNARPSALSDFTYAATWAGVRHRSRTDGDQCLTLRGRSTIVLEPMANKVSLIDAFARRIVGWRVSRSMQAGFVLDALEQALHARRPAQSDGVQPSLEPMALWLHSITATEAPSTSRSSMPSASPRSGSSPPSAASATATTTPSPRPSSAFSRPR